MNGSVEHLGQSHDHLRRSQNVMAWTTAIFGALLLSGLVWIANDIFHLKDQLMETDRRFDGIDAQMTALGTRIDDLNITIEQLGAELLATRSAPAPATGPDVSVLSTPNTAQNLQATANPPLETTAVDAAAQPLPATGQAAQPAQVQPVQQQAAVAPAQALAAAPTQPDLIIAPSPPAPRDQLTPEELAAPAPAIAAAPAPAAAAPAVEQAAPAAEAAPAADTQVAAAPAAEAAPAPAPAPAAPAANLSDDQLLSFNDDQIDPADELLLLDENGNPQ
ncbi:MAG: hypothetical protein ACR2QJ_11855 [Geminicoccaceae bacterium]